MFHGCSIKGLLQGIDIRGKMKGDLTGAAERLQAAARMLFAVMLTILRGSKRSCCVGRAMVKKTESCEGAIRF